MGLFIERKEGRLRFKWGFKQKAIAGALSLVLAITVGIVAVVAATQQNARVSTNVAYTVRDVAADVYVRATHVVGGNNGADVAVTAAMNIDSDGNGATEEYRVISTYGTTAKLLGLTQLTTMQFNDTDTQTGFSNGNNYQKYIGSKVDNYLENTWYTSRSAAFKSAVQEQTITQKCYAWTGTATNTYTI